MRFTDGRVARHSRFPNFTSPLRLLEAACGKIMYPEIEDPFYEPHYKESKSGSSICEAEPSGTWTSYILIPDPGLLVDPSELTLFRMAERVY